MFIVISGGGKIGSFLAQDLAGKGHGVVLIERRPEIVGRLARELPAGVLVIAGDGCDARHLEQAGIARADVFAAVTGEDAGNLVACQLARVSYHVRRAVARVNSPRNERIFRALGIEAISSTTVIGRLIEEEFGSAKSSSSSRSPRAASRSSSWTCPAAAARPAAGVSRNSNCRLRPCSRP